MYFFTKSITRRIHGTIRIIWKSDIGYNSILICSNSENWIYIEVYICFYVIEIEIWGLIYYITIIWYMLLDLKYKEKKVKKRILHLMNIVMWNIFQLTSLESSADSCIYVFTNRIIVSEVENCERGPPWSFYRTFNQLRYRMLICLY